MSDGQTHGERLEAGDPQCLAFGHLRVNIYRDGSLYFMPGKLHAAVSDRTGATALRAAIDKALGNPAPAAPDRTAMLREAYALAKSQGDYNAMAEIASQL